jgi:hypothetical protein
MNTRAALRQGGLSEQGIDRVEELEAQFLGDGLSKGKAAELAMSNYLDSLQQDMNLVRQRVEAKGGIIESLLPGD